MQIESVAIKNYKSFFDKQTINFEPGFNLLLGTNNAGKTSVLDVLDMDLGLNEPHRSERTIPIYGRQTSQHSQLEVKLRTNFEELWHLVKSSELYLPLTTTNDFHQDSNSSEVLKKFISSNGEIFLTSVFSNATESVIFKAGELINGIASRNNPSATLPAALIQLNSDNKFQINIANYGGLGSIAGTYAQLFKSKIYRFSAQRRPGFQGGGQGSNILDREAMALPYCLNNLQTNDAHGHKILCEWVNRVFPSVKWIQSTSNNSGFELRCLPKLPEERRDDLAIPMSRMGAGIGNVIAMFYVLMTSREPQVIAIDEPNAFLHPRALRELLAILEAEGKKHQFILTAHSADVLTAVNTRSISLLDFDGIATRVKQVGHKDLHFLRSDLAELGIRMTDLHAKDRVFWVEGQTEELVMPQLLRWACPEIAAGTSILRVESTGIFSKKKGISPEEVVKIYERLSSSSAIVPPMVCILLDGETHSPERRDEIEKSSKGKLRFLERRMLENYLFHPIAIEAVFKELDMPIAIEKIDEALTTHVKAEEISSLDGASVLHKIFSNLTESKLEFRKTRDVPILIDWLLANEPEYLAPLRSCLRKSFGI